MSFHPVASIILTTQDDTQNCEHDIVERVSIVLDYV